MGNTCNFLDSDPSHLNKYLDQDDKDEPNSSYAIEILDPKQLPNDLDHLRRVFEKQKILEPSWYEAGGSVKIDSLFFVKRYELYYRGEWKKGVPHGFGEVMTRDGQYFKGYFKEGIARGPKCLFAISPQTYYLGAVQRNQRNGYGKFIDCTYSYQGQWFDNFPTGRGKEILIDGDEYVGDFLQGKRDGEGTYHWKKGEFESYSGKFLKNEMSGYGQLKTRNGRVWKGQFCCSKDFIIDNVECKSQTRVFRGALRNLAPEKEFTIILSKDEKQIYVEQKYQLSNKNGKLNGRGFTTKPFKVFEDKILIHYDQSASADELEKILTIIQSNYSDSKKHSKTLQAIKHDLPGYVCSFWQEQDATDGMVIVPICGKYVRVTKRIQH